MFNYQWYQQTIQKKAGCSIMLSIFHFPFSIFHIPFSIFHSAFSMKDSREVSRARVTGGSTDQKITKNFDRIRYRHIFSKFRFCINSVFKLYLVFWWSLIWLLIFYTYRKFNSKCAKNEDEVSREVSRQAIIADYFPGVINFFFRSPFMQRKRKGN